MDAGSLLAAIVECSNDAIVGEGLDGTVLSWNAAAERIFGYRADEMIGQSIRSLIPDGRQAEEDTILAAISGGERVHGFETIRRHRDGTDIPVVVTVSPVHDVHGKVVAASMIARDISERLEAGRRIELLMLEVNHRSRNMLAMIQSLARCSAQQVNGHHDFVARLERRVAALLANQDLLVRRSWAGIPVRELVEAQLGFLGDSHGQVSHGGPLLEIAPYAAETIGMALHELAANAREFGALSVPDGRVRIAWGRSADGGLVMSWQESGGPPVQEPASSGFGSRLIVDVPRGKLRAAVDLDYSPGGLGWRLACPPEGVLP